MQTAATPASVAVRSHFRGRIDLRCAVSGHLVVTCLVSSLEDLLGCTRPVSLLPAVPALCIHDPGTSHIATGSHTITRRIVDTCTIRIFLRATSLGASRTGLSLIIDRVGEGGRNTWQCRLAQIVMTRTSPIDKRGGRESTSCDLSIGGSGKVAKAPRMQPGAELKRQAVNGDGRFTGRVQRCWIDGPTPGRRAVDHAVSDAVDRV